jgi:adenylate cyclase
MSETKAPDSTGKPPDRRKLVAVLYADMVGYSRLIGLDDTGTLERLRALRREVIDPAIGEHGGRLVNTGGDSLLIVFDSIDGAVRCAVTLQQQVPIHDGDRPPDRAIRFRIGINIGDAIADGTDLHGDAVNVAARIQAECPPGAICATRPVRDHVRDRFNLPFEELGALNLKNIARPVETFVLRPPTQQISTAPNPDPDSMPVRMGQTPRFSLVVLPFRSLGGKSDESHLAYAITNDLTIELARIPGVLVIAHTPTVAYKDGVVDVRRVGEELGVRYAVEGLIRKVGDILRISVQLIATTTSQHIWADRFEETLDEVAMGHDAVVRRISTTIDSRILDAEATNALRERPHDPDALDLLFRAWSLFKRPAEQKHLIQATELLEQALQLAPSMVPVILSLADRLIHRFTAPDTMDWGKLDLIDHATELLSRAEQIEPNNEWLTFYQGSLLRARGRWREASLSLQRLIMAHPNNYAAHRILGRCLMIMGRPSEAIPLFQRSVRLDPLSPLNRVSYAMIGNCLLLQGKASEAVDWLQHGLDETSENERRSRGLQNLYLASAYALMHDAERATRTLSEANQCWPFWTVHSLWPFYEPRGLPERAYTEQIRLIQDGLRLAGLREVADEAPDFGVAATRLLSPDPMGRTPVFCPGVMSIQTAGLVSLLEERLPVLIDVALGSWGKSIPGAVGLQGTGHGGEFSEKVQDRFWHKIVDLTNGDLSAPIVVFCVNSERFTAYNLALRLVAIGCTSVYWYRGGIETWQVHELPTNDLVLEDW